MHSNWNAFTNVAYASSLYCFVFTESICIFFKLQTSVSNNNSGNILYLILAKVHHAFIIIFCFLLILSVHSYTKFRQNYQDFYLDLAGNIINITATLANISNRKAHVCMPFWKPTSLVHIFCFIFLLLKYYLIEVNV